MSAAIDNERFRKLLRSYPASAIRLLYDFYYQALLRIARNLIHDQDAAADIVQDTFLHVWEKRIELATHHDRSIEHYLVRVVRNKSITYYKKQRNLQVDAAFLTQLRTSHESPVETQLIEKELMKEIRVLITTFPNRERQCLLMKIDDGLTIDQIAFKLNVSRKAVERSLTAANKRLRKWGKKN